MLKVLRHLVQEITGAESLQQALLKAVARVRDALETGACAIFLVDAESGGFVLAAADGIATGLEGKLHIPLDQGLIGLVAERKEAVNLENASEHERYLSAPDSGEERFKAFLGVPILHRKRLLGVLIVEQEEARRYDSAEEAFLVTLAVQLASAIEEVGSKELLSHSKTAQISGLPEVLRGIPSSSGVGVGSIVVVYPPADLEAVPEQETDDVEEEVGLFSEALELTRNEIRLLGDRLANSIGPEEKALFDAYLMMLDSDTLQDEIIHEIREGVTAQTALKRVIKEHVRQFSGIENEYLQERATDIEDLGRRILANLQSEGHTDLNYPAKTILVGNEVSAVHLAEVPEGKLAGIISGKGSSNSHVAILGRALGVAAVMGVGELPLQRLNGLEVIVDGYLGQVYLRPDERLLEEFQALANEEHELDADLSELRELPAETTDGHRISLYMNTGLLADVSYSMSAGAEGVGLYRTEVPFMTRDRFPSSEEQRVIYRQLLNVFSPRPVIMRTLDIGGDKPLSYFTMEEDNPFLGWRGIRVLLEHPEIFLNQVRAMLRASEGFENLRIMLPMISDVSEAEESLRLIKMAYAELVKEGLEITMPEVGVMIEVPSAVYQAQALAKRVDFLSVGSNDLTQYLLAVDRNNSRVSSLYDALHPSVLKALLQVVEGAHREGKTVSICGEMAGEPAAVVLLLAMGFDLLSMSAPVLPRVKWVIRKFSMSRARKLLSEVLLMSSATDIRRHLEFALEEEGLGGLIRAGRH